MDLFLLSQENIKNDDIEIIKDSRGLILRFTFDNAIEEYTRLSERTLNNLESIKYFLAKIENPAIIEVHTKVEDSKSVTNLRNWEVSTIIANNIEAIITKPCGNIEQNRINSIGYGEFLPSKNTSNNGGKNQNRIDIMILCNVSGE